MSGWANYLFPAKKVLNQAAQGPTDPNANSGPSQPANLDIAKMAQGMANQAKTNFTGPQSAYGQVKSMMPTPVPKMGQPGTAPQPTMQQLSGAGGSGTSCPTCGAPMSGPMPSNQPGNQQQ